MRKKEIVINLQGGLGNQLFQLAALQYVSNKNNRTPILNLTKISTGKSPRVFGLEENILKNLFNEVPILINSKHFYYLNRIKWIMKRFIPRAFFFKTFFAQGPGYESALEVPASFRVMEGYFQTYRYVNTLNWKKILTLNRPRKSTYSQLEEEIVSKNPIVMHIRGGDYLKDTSGFGTLSPKYFSSGINAFGKQPTEIWVFTDDVTYAKSIMDKIATPYRIVDIENALTEFETILLFSLAKKIIISNSTFAWWGAYLSEDSAIICPLKWYKKMVDPIDLIPQEWTKIESDWDH